MKRNVSFKWVLSMSATVFSRSRFTVLVMIGVYPLVTGLFYAIIPFTEGWATWQRTAILVPLVVVSMVWAIIPFIHRRCDAFLHRKR